MQRFCKLTGNALQYYTVVRKLQFFSILSIRKNENQEIGLTDLPSTDILCIQTSV
jgi:hypothetical protein